MKPSLVPLPVGHADPARGDGRFDPPVNCQVAINPVREPGEQFTPLGYRDKDLPYYAAAIHMDGNITMAAAQEAQQGTPEEIYLRHFATGPKGDIGPSPDVVGHNFGVLFQDPRGLRDVTRTDRGTTLVSRRILFKRGGGDAFRGTAGSLMFRMKVPLGFSTRRSCSAMGKNQST